jgi:hypothetical protein
MNIDSPEYKAWKDAGCRVRNQRACINQAIAHRDLKRAHKAQAGLRRLEAEERAAFNLLMDAQEAPRQVNLMDALRRSTPEEN